MSRHDGEFSWVDGVTLTEHFDERFRAQEKALELAYASMEKRLDGMNEFRQALRDQNSLFVNRAEHDALVADIRGLREFRAGLEGVASAKSVYIAFAISVLSLAFSLVHWFSHLP